jgi:hypothetical protein
MSHREHTCTMIARAWANYGFEVKNDGGSWWKLARFFAEAVPRFHVVLIELMSSSEGCYVNVSPYVSKS